MNSKEAARLAQQCIPALQAKGLSTIGSVASVRSSLLSGVWTGEGGIVQIVAQGGSGGAEAHIVAKSIGTYKNCDDMGLQDHWSYYNEAAFYETDLPDRMCAAGVHCPRPLYVERTASGQPHGRLPSRRTISGNLVERSSGLQSSERMQKLLRRFKVLPEDGGEERDQAIICMTRLQGTSWRPSQAEPALSWLAKLHALFWGAERTSAAVAAGVSDQTGFWHLDNRSIEFKRMGKGPLKLAAAGIDARLKADSMQTLCHGDPKGANIMWDDEKGVVMYDFQWFGKGPPTKDLTYFFATAAMNGGRWDQTKEEKYLRFYYKELCSLLEAQGDKPPAFEYLHDSYRLACFDYRRWQEGGFAWGNQAMLDGNAEYVLSKISADGKAPATAEEFQAKIFECFPP